MAPVMQRGEVYPSQIEAKWANYLYMLEIFYEHEPFSCTHDGLTYIPDFWLPEHHVCLEVKLKHVTLLDLSRWRAYLFTVPTASLVVVSGPVPGVWSVTFRYPDEVPNTLENLSMLWQHGPMPQIEHDTVAAKAAEKGSVKWRDPTVQELRERRKHLSNLPPWKEWIRA